MPKFLRTAIATLIAAAALVSCENSTPSNAATSPTTTSESTSGSQLTVDIAGTAVYRDTLGVATLIKNSGAHGIRDIELSIEFSAGKTPVLAMDDVLAFCPAGATCPWGTSFGVTDDSHRSIDSAKVSITRLGPTFDTGVVRPLDLRIDGGSLSFDLPARPGVAILYVVKNDTPYFGMFTSHQFAEATTLRLTDSELPIGPETRGVFYEGHVPESMIVGGD